MSTPTFLRVEPDGVLLSIKLQPKASANEIGTLLHNELRVKVTAPPVHDAANQALTRLLADTLGCGRRQVELLRGHTSRHKLVKVFGLSEREVASRLMGR